MLYSHAEIELPPFSGVSPFTSWDPFQLLTLGLIVAAALYIWGVVRLTQRGDKWPIHRSVLFLVGGIGSIAFVTIGGIGAYDDQLLSIHMVQHMVLAMVAPICLALGAPVTLALRTLPVRPRRWLLAALHSKIAKVLSFPLVSFSLYVATPFALYFSGLYHLAVTNDLFHNLTHVHFILVGCLFFWPLVGIDPLPGRWPYPGRALLMVLSTPFHAVLGLTVMQSTALIGGSYYPSLHLDWANPADDQRLAGGILWAGGELVTVIMLAALVAQWMRSADREARRVDRQLDREEAMARAAARQAQLALGGGRVVRLGNDGLDGVTGGALAAGTAAESAVGGDATLAGEAAFARDGTGDDPAPTGDSADDFAGVGDGAIEDSAVRDGAVGDGAVGDGADERRGATVDARQEKVVRERARREVRAKEAVWAAATGIPMMDESEMAAAAVRHHGGPVTPAPAQSASASPNPDEPASGGAAGRSGTDRAPRP